MTKISSLIQYTSRLAVFVLLLACTFSFSQSQENYNLLWKIEGKNMTSPSYLFGTMHVDDARAFQFSDAVMPAIKSCEVFALEVNPDSVSIVLNSKVFTKAPKDEFKSVLNDKDYKRLVDRFTEVNGFSFEDSEIRDPNVILTMLYPDENKKNDKSTYVDMYLVGQAKTMRKKITGLEDIETQISHYEMLDKSEKKAYILKQIESTVAEIDSLKNVMTEIYYSGNIYEIERIIDEDFGGTDEEMIERNKVMTSSIEKIIKKKSLFSAVGAAHLPGEYGVINLLKERGYKLSPVVANFTGVADTYKIDQEKFEWYTFADKDLGYSLELPNAPNYSEDSGNFTLHTYTSLLDNTVYMMFGLDFRFTPGDTLPKQNIVNRYLGSIEDNYNGKIIDKKEIDFDGGTHIKSTLITNDNRTIKSQMTVKDKMVYYLTVQIDSTSSDLKSVDRFFNSLKFLEPKPLEIKPIDWETYTYDDAAFSIALPGKPKNISRQTPNPVDPEGDPYYLNMFSIVDNENEDNYLFRFNDLPNGYFMEDPEEGFNSMYQNMVSNGTIVSDPKVIFLNGYEGRQYEVLLREKYHTFIRVYFRGNRTYLLLHQKLNETDKATLDSPFFNDFKFIDYKPTALETYRIEGTEIEFKKFGNVKTLFDTEDYDTSYLKGSNEYYTTNPSTGDVYQFGYGEFQDYFKIKDLNEFYDLNLETLKDWNDTIINKRPIKVGDVEGMEAYIKGKNSSGMSKHHLWIQNKRLYMFTAFTAQEDFNKVVTDSIFSSFRDHSKPSTFDMYASKTSKIIKGLRSKDTITRNRAIGAFDYYEFELDDLQKLHKALATNFGDDELNETVRTKILSEFYELNNENTLGVVKTLYEDAKSSDEIKSAILALVHQIDDKDAITTYLEMLFENPPKEIENYSWQIFSPLRDSVPLALANYDKLVELTNIEDFRNTVLGISADILTNKQDSSQIVSSKIDKLMTYSREDLANYITETSDTTSYNYTYNGRVYNYLRLMDTQLVDRSLTDEFTNKLMNREDNDWFKTNAVVARIRNELPVKKSLLNAQMDSLSSRYRVIKAYHNINKLNKVPKTYLEAENMAKLSLTNYLEDSDDYGSKISLLGTIQIDGKTYYGASINYEYDDVKESYFSLIGPVYEISQDKDFELYDITLDWSELADDWKSQAKALLKESEEDN
ncbi:TraB/GumN family protein [uncultured Psychroserpens sp.]|uniref:TraB/GumN family protein n=1 Tax=uncultured Psychroserpens sp. TaxID=255436 RepID=UPI00260F5047|nr:TraB/GumN family protein [uncultured Psychroserpens sp.]